MKCDKHHGPYGLLPAYSEGKISITNLLKFGISQNCVHESNKIKNKNKKTTKIMLFVVIFMSKNYNITQSTHKDTY